MALARIHGVCFHTRPERLAEALQQIARLRGTFAERWQIDGGRLAIDATGEVDDATEDLLGAVAFDLLERAEGGALVVEGPAIGRFRYGPGGRCRWQPDALPPGARARWGSLRMLSDGGVSSLAVSPDGRWLATAEAHPHLAHVRVWELATGALVLDLDPRGEQDPGDDDDDDGPAMLHTHRVGLAFAPDGARLYLAGPDERVQALELATGRVLRTCAPGPLLTCAALSSDGARLAVGGASSTAHVLDAATLEPLAELATDLHGVRRLAFGPGDRLALCGFDTPLELWDARAGERLAIAAGGFLDLAYAPQGRLVALERKKGRPGALARLEPTKKQGLKVHVRHDMFSGRDHAGPFALTPDGAHLIAAGAAGLGVVALTGGAARTLPLPGDLTALACSPDGARVYAVAAGRVLTVDLAEGRHDLGPGWLSDLDATPDGAAALLRSDPGGLARVDLATGARQPPLSREPEVYAALAPAGDAAAVWDDTLRIVALASGEVLWKKKLGLYRCPLRFAAGGSALALDAYPPQLLALPSGKLRQLGDSGALLAAGDRWIVTGEGPRVALWDARTGEPGARLEHGEGEVGCAALGPDERALVTGSDAAVRAWDPGRAAPRWTRTQGAKHLEYSRDGSRVAASTWGVIEILDAATGALLARRHGHVGAAALRFLADGDLLSVGERDGTLVRWEQLAPASAWQPPPALREVLAAKPTRARPAKPAEAPAKPAAARTLRSGLTPIAPWTARPWPPLDFVARDAEGCEEFERRGFTSLRIRGELHYDDLESLRAALAGLDDAAYVEFYGARDFTVDGLRLTIDLDGELEADCTEIDEGFLALVGPARAGEVVVHAGPAISGRRYAAGAAYRQSALPALPPGAVQRFGAASPRADGDERRRWEFPQRTWSFDQGYRDATLRVRAPDGALLAERSADLAGVEVAAGGDAALWLGREGLEVLGPDLVPRCRLPLRERLTQAAISDDGAYVAIVDGHGERLRICDGRTGAALHRFAGGFGPCEFVRADRLAVGGHSEALAGDGDGDERLFLLDPRDGAPIAAHRLDDVRRVVPHVSGDSFSVLHGDRVAGFADADGAARGDLQLVEFTGDRLARAADGSWRAPPGRGRWDPRAGLPLHDHHGPLAALALAGDRIVSLDGDLLIVRDFAGRVLHRGQPPGGPCEQATLHGERLALVQGGRLRIFDLSRGTWLESRDLGVTAACFLPDGRLLTGHKNGSVREWPAPYEVASATHALARKPIHTLVASPTGAHVLALAEDGRARLLAGPDLGLRGEAPADRHARAAAVTDAGTFLVGDAEGAALYDADGALVRRVAELRPGAAVADGAHLVVALERFLYWLDARSGERLGVLEGHEGPVTALALGAGRLLSADHSLLVWDRAALQRLGHTHPLDGAMNPLP